MAAKKKTSARHKLRPGQVVDVLLVSFGGGGVLGYFWEKKIADIAGEEATASGGGTWRVETKRAIVDENGGTWVDGLLVRVAFETPSAIRERAIEKLRLSTLTEDELATVLSPSILARVVERSS